MTSLSAFSIRTVAGVLLAALLLSGCANGELAMPRMTGPLFKPGNHLGEVRLPVAIRRVALLPLHGGKVVPAESLDMLDRGFLQELLRVERFEAVLLTRETMVRLFGERQFSSVEALPHEFLAAIARDQAVDAVLFIDITSYSAYQPLQIGVRAKLAATATGNLLWSFDTLFSADNPTVVNSARLFALGGKKGARPLIDRSSSVLQSPSQFGTYAAATTFATLPPR